MRRRHARALAEIGFDSADEIGFPVGATVVIARFVLAVLTGALGIVLALPLIVLGSPFWAVALTARGLARLLEPKHSPWKAFIEFDPAFGWKPKANVVAYHVGDEDVCHVTTDHEGWRGRGSILESEIVVFGDSFAWGQGIEDKRFFANLVPDLRIKAIGVMGYNMVQELLWLERLSSQLRGKLVVWFVYFGNDLFENLAPHMQGYRMPFLRRAGDAGAWEIVTSHITPSKWFDMPLTGGRVYYKTLAECCSLTRPAQRAYSACEFLLRKGNEVCRDAGARLVVMTIPEKTQLSAGGSEFLLRHGGDRDTFDPDLPDRAIGAMCERLGISFVAGKACLDLGDYKDRDCHWNEKGHRRVAEILSSLYDVHKGRSPSGTLPGSTDIRYTSGRHMFRRTPNLR